MTGANGFIGQTLCKRLLAEGCHVRGAVRSLKSQNNLPRGVEPVIIGSIGSRIDWSKKLVDIDAVVHLAARVHVMDDKSDNSLVAYRTVNLTGTECLAQEAASAGIKRFVYLSSVKVNGEGKEIPYTENDNPAPKDSYGISKWEAEQVLNKIAGKTGLKVVILRPSLVYGPGVKANFLQLIKSVEYGIPLPLASINNLRSFIYIENLIDAIFFCMKNPKAVGQTYLISDDNDISTPEIIRRIAFALKKPAHFFNFPVVLLKMAGLISGKYSIVRRLTDSLTVDISKIKNELDWAPPFTIKEGMSKTAKWYYNEYRRQEK